jgi:hypothetical protein
MSTSKHAVLNDTRTVTVRTSPLRHFLASCKRFVQAMDYSSTDYTFDRMKALELRVLQLEKASVGTSENGARSPATSEACDRPTTTPPSRGAGTW